MLFAFYKKMMCKICEYVDTMQQFGYEIMIINGVFVWNKQNVDRFRPFLAPNQHAQARMLIHDDLSIKTTVRTMRKSENHSHKIQNSNWLIFFYQLTK